ncbi:hypothetical protein RUM43_004256 [Polyplax serrata]|uniref:Uncharacterized protein n=1 Tax=Polyplax serrata TaxID=468196 RepID=A0AAN8SBT5_POLSC
MSVQLVAATAITVVSTYIVIGAYRKKLSNDLKSGTLYRDAYGLLMSHKACEILGKPIQEGDASFINTSWSFNGSAEFQVKLNGSKKNGILFITALGDDEKTLELDTVHLQIGFDKTRRIVIKDSD